MFGSRCQAWESAKFNRWDMIVLRRLARCVGWTPLFMSTDLQAPMLKRWMKKASSTLRGSQPYQAVE
jgi:hypothetical protein